jgi:hypothetical protein
MERKNISLRNNWEEAYTELSTYEATRGTIWWKIRLWILKRVMRNNE